MRPAEFGFSGAHKCKRMSNVVKNITKSAWHDF